MRYKLFINLGLILTSISWCASATPVKPETVLAVMDIINNTGEYQAFVDGMPDMLITELMESGEIKLVERTKVQTAMKALKLETSGLTQERNLELGKWLGVDGILFGAFNRVGDQYRLDVRAIDVQTGKINVAASSSCGRQNIQDIIPEIGKQLRLKLGNIGLAKENSASPARPIAPIVTSPSKPLKDSVQLMIEYKMNVAIFAEVNIPHQRVRIFLDNTSLALSEVIDHLDHYFILFNGNISVGEHTLSFVHGAVDKQGRWLHELSNQPEPFHFSVHKQDRPSITYKMVAHEGSFDFKDFQLNLFNHNNGE